MGESGIPDARGGCQLVTKIADGEDEEVGEKNGTSAHATTTNERLQLTSADGLESCAPHLTVADCVFAAAFNAYPRRRPCRRCTSENTESQEEEEEEVKK